MKPRIEIGSSLVMILAIVMPFPVRITGLVTFIISICYFVYLVASKKVDRNLLKNRLFLLLIISFAIMVIGCLWGDYNTGLMVLERGLFLIAFPIVIYHARISSLTVSQIVMAFFVGCFLVSLAGWINVFWTADYSIVREGHTKFTSVLDIHPAYLSAYFVFLFFFFTESIKKNYFTIPKRLTLLYGAAALYSLTIVFFLRSQISMLSFVILLFVYFIIRLKKRAWLVSFVLFTLLFLNYLFDTHRVSTFFDQYGKNVSTALDDRIKLWTGVAEGIKMSPILGAGTGSEQTLINEGYKKVGYLDGIKYTYNAHNQYLQFWSRNGVAELLCFLILLTYLFLRAVKMRSLAFLIFLMMVSLIMFTESFLNVQKGIVFFYFFACVFTMIRGEQSDPVAK